MLLDTLNPNRVHGTTAVKFNTPIDMSNLENNINSEGIFVLHIFYFTRTLFFITVIFTIYVLSLSIFYITNV